MLNFLTFFLFSMCFFQVFTRSPSFECVPPDAPDSTTLVLPKVLLFSKLLSVDVYV
jgi:hypothetical protein